MIQPQELRKGNLLSWNPALTHPETTLPAMEVEVYLIHPDKIGYVYPNTEHRVEPFEDDVAQMGGKYKPFEELEPITLTPQILERAKFKKDGNDWIHNNKSFKLEGNTVNYNGNKSDSTVQYLHHLQNVFFKLTGEELEIDHS